MSDAPDGCPVHGLAVRDPGATVQIYDGTGRYLYPMSAERACDSHHAGVVIDRYIRQRLAPLNRPTTTGELPRAFRR